VDFVNIVPIPKGMIVNQMLNLKQMSGRTAAERHAIPEDLLIREFPR
jgi:hypothetical protein